MSMNGYFARWILCSGTTSVDFGLYSSMVGVCCDCEARAHSSAAEQMHATVAAETEIAGQDFIDRSSGETRIVSHRAAAEPNVQAEGRASDLDEAPLLAPRQAGHLARRTFRLYDEVVGEIRADAVLGIVQTRLDGKGHARFEHSVVAQRQIRLLVALPAFAVRGPVIDIGSDAILHLVLVNFVRHGGAGDAGDGLFLLHQAAVAAHGPKFFHLIG